MDKALVGFLVVFGTFHLLLVAIPIMNTLQASISRKSKLFWSLFLVLLPLIGVAIFHFRFRASLFHGETYKISAADERARSGTLAPRDDD